jgi:hypothetical protein
VQERAARGERQVEVDVEGSARLVAHIHGGVEVHESEGHDEEQQGHDVVPNVVEAARSPSRERRRRRRRQEMARPVRARRDGARKRKRCTAVKEISWQAKTAQPAASRCGAHRAHAMRRLDKQGTQRSPPPRHSTAGTSERQSRRACSRKSSARRHSLVLAAKEVVEVLVDGDGGAVEVGHLALVVVELGRHDALDGVVQRRQVVRPQPVRLRRRGERGGGAERGASH